MKFLRWLIFPEYFLPPLKTKENLTNLVLWCGLHCVFILYNKPVRLLFGSTVSWKRLLNFYYLPCYRVCHGFRFTTRDDYFWVNFDHFWIERHFMRQLGQYWKSARAYEIQPATKLSLSKSVKLTVSSFQRQQQLPASERETQDLETKLV